MNIAEVTRSLGRLGLGIIMVIGCGAQVATATTLADLAPGSAYRYAFATADRTSATSTDIATYNAFVTAEAAQNAALGSVQFRVLGSTATVNAVSNIACGSVCDGLPIFNLAGVEIAANSAQLFSGSLFTGINLNQFGVSIGRRGPFTGTNADVTTASSPLGGDASGLVEVGSSTSTTGTYLAQPATALNTVLTNVYAISVDAFQTAGAADVPEPSAALMVAAGLAAVGIGRGLRRST